jgi:hypothetical protein
MLTFLAWVGGLGALVTIGWFVWWLRDRRRPAISPAPIEPKVRPLVYADKAAVTGSNNVDVQLHNESNHLATNVHVELRQGDAVIGTKSVPTVAGHGLPPRTDLLPPGTGGQFVPTGLEWSATCTYRGPDGSWWRSVRVSRPGNTDSTLHFEEL